MGTQVWLYLFTNLFISLQLIYSIPFTSLFRGKIFVKFIKYIYETEVPPSCIVRWGVHTPTRITEGRFLMPYLFVTFLKILPFWTVHDEVGSLVPIVAHCSTTNMYDYI